MNASDQWASTVDEAFLVAYLLTGSATDAEEVVLEAIAACGRDIPDEAFVAEAVRSAVKRCRTRPMAVGGFAEVPGAARR